MQRRSAKNRHSNARTPAETKIRELSGRKSPQKRAIRRRAGNVRFAETGWWCAQSDTNRSPLHIRLRTGNFLQNSGSEMYAGIACGPQGARRVVCAFGWKGLAQLARTAKRVREALRGLGGSVEVGSYRGTAIE